MGHKKEEKHAEEAGGEKVPLWYISFADMITLLMSFFVMLSTFSSYDFSARKKLMETMHSIAFFSLAPSKEKAKESIVKEPPVPSEWVMEGSEQKPEDQNPLDETKYEKPKPYTWIPEIDAFRDRRIIRIPTSKLFYGDGTSIKDEGKECLDLIGNFVKQVQCQVVVGATSGGRPGTFAATPQGKLDRAWAVMQYLQKKRFLPAERFSLAGTPLSGPDHQAGDAIEITLLSWSVVK